MASKSSDDHSKTVSDILSVLPDALIPMPRWLLWRYEDNGRPKLVKTPYYINGRRRKGILDTEADLAQLVSFDQAYEVYLLSEVPYSGLGIALAGDGVGAFDLDHILDEEGHLIKAHAGYRLVLAAEKAGCYIERSPSGRGLRIVGPCTNKAKYSKDGLEYWGASRYVTLTGDCWANPKGWIGLDDLRDPLGTDHGRVAEDEDFDTIITPKTLAAIQSALDVMDSDERDLWIKVGMALKTIGPKGFQLFLEWSQKSPKFVSEEDVEYTWDNLRPARTNYKAILAEARDNWGWSNHKEDDDDDEEMAERSGTREVLLGEFRLAPTEFVLDGFLPVGVSVIAGAWGAGKTTNLIPLLASVAHLTPPDWGFHPTLRRKVIWVSEDANQVRDTLYSLAKAGKVPWAQVSEWFKLFRAKRMDPKKLAKWIGGMIEANTVVAPNGFKIKPVVALDTVSANLDLENESDNSEVANAMSQLKQTLVDVPVILVGHTPKAVARGDLALTTFRGAGAWEAEAVATYYLIYDEETEMRFLAIRKARFVPDYREVQFDHEGGSEIVDTPWDEPQSKGYMHGVPRKSDGSERRQARDEAREERVEQRRERALSDRQNAVMEVIMNRTGRGEPTTRSDLRREVGGKNELLIGAVNRLLESGLIEAHPWDFERLGVNHSNDPQFLLPEGVDRALFLQRAVVPETGG